MRMSKSNSLFFVIALLSIMFLACMSGEAQAQGKVKLRVTQLMQFTGPMAGGQVGICEGYTDAVEAFNKYSPIPGAEIVSNCVDAGSDAAKGMAAFKQMSEGSDAVVAVSGQSTGIAIALKKWNIRKKIINLEAGVDDELLSLPSWTFSHSVPYVNTVAAWVDYYMANIWPKKKLKRAPRMAWLTWDNAFGRSAITPKTIAYVKSKGIEIVDEEFIPLMPTDTGAQVMRMLEKGVDFTYGNGYHNAFAVVLKDMERFDAIDKIVIGIGYATAPNALIDAVSEGGRKDLTRNTYMTRISRDISEWPVYAPRVWEIYKAKKRNVTDHTYGMAFAQGLVTCEAVRLAAQKVGAAKVDGPAVYDAVQTIKNFDPYGIGPAISYSATKRYGRDSVFVQLLRGNKVTTLKEQAAKDLTTVKQ